MSDFRKGGLTLEPKEKGGEVTISSGERPCIIIDIPPDEVCTINNLRMLLRGPNKSDDMKAYRG